MRFMNDAFFVEMMGRINMEFLENDGVEEDLSDSMLSFTAIRKKFPSKERWAIASSIAAGSLALAGAVLIARNKKNTERIKSA